MAMVPSIKYLIFGDNQLRSVDIEQNKTSSWLKKQIHEDISFSIDLKDIILRRVCEPFAEFDPAKDPNGYPEVSYVTPLSKLFPETSDDFLHILVCKRSTFTMISVVR